MGAGRGADVIERLTDPIATGGAVGVVVGCGVAGRGARAAGGSGEQPDPVVQGVGNVDVAEAVRGDALGFYRTQRAQETPAQAPSSRARAHGELWLRAARRRPSAELRREPLSLRPAWVSGWGSCGFATPGT